MYHARRRIKRLGGKNKDSDAGKMNGGLTWLTHSFNCSIPIIQGF